MQEGESELGGLKIPHGNTTPPSSTPGPQPAASAATNSEPAPSPTPTPNPQPATSPVPQPNPLPVTPPQVSTNPTPAPQPQPAPSQPPRPQTSPLQPAQLPQSPQPFPAQPISSSVTNLPPATNTFSNTPTPPAAVFPTTGDIVLGEPKPKNKAKKWIIGIVVAIVAVLGVIGLVVTTTLINSPSDEESIEDYYKDISSDFTNNYANIIAFGDLINICHNNKLSFYELFLPRYALQGEMSAIFNNNVPIPSAHTPILPEILDNRRLDLISSDTFRQYVDNFDNYLASLQQQDIDENLKRAVKELQAMLPRYSEIAKTLLDEIHSLQSAFNDTDITAIENFAANHDFSYDTRGQLIEYAKEYQQILNVWDDYKNGQMNSSSEYYGLLDPRMLREMDEDTYTVSNIINKLISIDEDDFITEFSKKVSGINESLYILYGGLIGERQN